MTATMLLVYTLVSVMYVSNLYTRQKDSTAKSVESYALNTSSGIGQEFKGLYWGAQNIALNRIFEDKTNVADIEGFLSAMVEQKSSYELIVFIDANGKFVASNSNSYEGTKVNREVLRAKNFSTLAWFNRALKEEYTDEEDLGLMGTYVEDFHRDSLVSEVMGKESYLSGFSAAVKNKSGQIIGVLSVRTNMDWVKERFEDLYTSMSKEGIFKTEAYFVNKKGKSMFHHSPYEKLNTGFLTTDLLAMGVGGVKEAVVDANSGFGSGIKAFVDKAPSFVGYTNLSFDTMSMLGWGIVVNVEENQLIGALSNQVGIFYALVVLMCGAFLLTALKLTTRESDKLVLTTEALKARSNSSVITSGNLNKVSSELSDAARLQQEAVQETMAALDQMMSMLSNTNKYVEESLSAADGVNKRTQEGNKIMIKMEDSMQSIQNSNADLEKISKIIQTISEKTNVINEIVFNTKLLAFNASIEAARAGVHGKGFAVVAEEVGGLAQLSGEAAQEIDNLIKESKSQVTLVVSDIRERITQGDKVAGSAQEKFQEISVGLGQMTQKVRDILGATAEQESGIKKVNEAMRNIDDLTHRNLALAHDSDSLSKSVNEEAFKLEAIMEQVRKLLLGSSGLENLARKAMGKNDQMRPRKTNRKKTFPRAS